VTIYSHAPERRALVATWTTGLGHVTADVAEVEGSEGAAAALADALTGLSRVLWRTYTHPAAAAGDPEEPNTEAWRRAAERSAFDRVGEAMRAPARADANGMLLESFVLVEEGAHRVGRALDAFDGSVRDQVAADVAAECDAVLAAERGELTGRAAQAAGLTRPLPAPAQVDAATAHLRAHPLGDGLLGAFEPTSAAVAVAPFLLASARLAAAVAGLPRPQGVFAEADNIEAVRVEIPQEVVARLDGGEPAEEVVADLLAEALAVADGHAADVDAVAHRLAGGDDRLALLDPQRPALDLLEDLIDGLQAAALLVRDGYGDDDPDGDDPDGDRDEPDAEMWRQREAAWTGRWWTRVLAAVDAPGGRRLTIVPGTGIDVIDAEQVAAVVTLLGRPGRVPSAAELERQPVAVLAAAALAVFAERGAVEIRVEPDRLAELRAAVQAAARTAKLPHRTLARGGFLVVEDPHGRYDAWLSTPDGQAYQRSVNARVGEVLGSAFGGPPGGDRRGR